MNEVSRRILNHHWLSWWVGIIVLVLAAGCSLNSSPAGTNPVATQPGGTSPVATLPVTTGPVETEPTRTGITSSTSTVPLGRGKLLEAVPADVKAGLARGVGSDAPDLVYASDDTIIINAGFGLLVYDLKTRAVVSSLDLATIGCNYFQGDFACEITVSPDGMVIQLHPASSDTMFQYDLRNQTLYGEIPYQKMEDRFKTELIADVPDKILPTDWPSGRAVRFTDGTYGFLKVPKGKLQQIAYVRGGRSQRLFP